MLIGFTWTFVSRWCSFLMASIPSASTLTVVDSCLDSCHLFRVSESLPLYPNYVRMLLCRQQNDGRNSETNLDILKWFAMLESL